MAQAARLNLRMQKELKLLLTDPPPAASFPSLSDSSSLTSIDADFQGPEGTVYANGVFKIKIQIPERYPFQPPIVTFGTPIYHPNIDTGGRICLDILNLPPKGSWQPSLNISTVLTSIGLLLSEPNPDDGLMHEASREYKYDRQTFDQKARSMTEKYAKPGESRSYVNSHEIQTHTCQNTLQNEVKGYATNSVIEHSVCNTRSSGSSKKLSLGSSSNCDSGKEIYKVPDHDSSYNQSETKRVEDAKTIGIEHYNNPEKLQATRNKLAIGSRSGIGVVANGNVPNHCKSQLEAENPSEVSPDQQPLGHVGKNEKQVTYLAKDSTESCSISINQETLSLESLKRSMDFDKKVYHSVPTHDTINPQKDVIERSRGGSTSTRPKKLGLVGSKTSYKPEHEKENPAPIQCLLYKPSDPSAASPIKSPIVSENGIYQRQSRWKQSLNMAQKLSGMSTRLPLKLQDNNPSHFEIPSSPQSKFLHATNDARLDKEQQTNQVLDKESTFNGGSHIHEATIVSDSEDSGDDNVPVRSKSWLTRKCLSKKRKLFIR